MVLGRLLTAQYLLRTRGVAWPNTSPCHGEDRRFESGRVRPRSVFSVFSRIVRGFLYKFETKALAQDLRNALFFSESSESAFKTLTAQKEKIDQYYLGVSRLDFENYLNYGSLPFMIALDNEALVYDQIIR